MTELAAFYLGDSLLVFPIITGVAFTYSPFHASYSKILGIVIPVGAFNLVLERERERLYGGGQRWGWLCTTSLSGRSSREESLEYSDKSQGSHSPVLSNGNENHKYNPRVSWRNISRAGTGDSSIMQRASGMVSSRSWCNLLFCHLLSSENMSWLHSMNQKQVVYLAEQKLLLVCTQISINL